MLSSKKDGGTSAGASPLTISKSRAKLLAGETVTKPSVPASLRANISISTRPNE